MAAVHKDSFAEAFGKKKTQFSGFIFGISHCDACLMVHNYIFSVCDFSCIMLEDFFVNVN